MAANTKADVKKRRSPEQKHGKYKWIKTLVRRNSEDIREIKRMLRGLSYGLRHLMDFQGQYLVDMVCQDSRDQAILDVLRSAGSDGLSPKEIHARVRRYGLKYHHISRRINRMNKRMQNEIGERLADKVGWKWALSNFMHCNWSAKTSEIHSESHS
ncbi:MAG: hypothetical protein OEY22_07115 [Candidatus Bathyarchaeota archaeon]|nr:hypothetical protein [Candidatus Bathyarchaeota archaeon]MDH5786754.1 hypothetical protein [Candidatus Bathyarchaeota archaeon]